MGLLRSALVFLPFVAQLHAADAAAGVNRFTTDSYVQLARGTDNLIVSPFCNYTVLTLLLEGARGQTAAQIAKALHLAYPNSDHYSSVTWLADQLQGHDGAEGSELSTAWALWVQQGFHIRADFERTAQQFFHTAVTQYDFAGKPEQARVAINFWAANQTKGKVQDLFAPGTLGRDTRLVATTAIYFRGVWQEAFRFEATHPAPFHTSAKTSQNVDTMTQTSTFGYADSPAAQILEMKYGKSTIVLDVVLPKTIEGLHSLEQSLTPEKLSGFWSSLNSRNVAVSLPKFRLATDLSIKEMLEHMGISDAFGGSADFSAIDDRRDLILSDVRHKAFIDVNEEGTTAAAASGAAVRLTAVAAPPVQFRADHPFLFFIRDTHTGVLLFAGRLMHPEK